MAMLARMAAAALAFAALSEAAAARITRVEYTRVEPAFGDMAFGDVGAYDRIVGRAYGEIDPALAVNSIIQDIGLAPVNARGLVEYQTDIEILKPREVDRGNGVLLFNILNRGNKGAIGAFNADMSGAVADINNLTAPGDGFLMRQGYTLVWFGWQADVAPGAGRMTLAAPVARNEDGGVITGLVRSELTTLVETRTLNLSSGWFTTTTHASYPTAELDNRVVFSDGFQPTLTVRFREGAPRTPILNSRWSFGACGEDGVVTPSPTQICFQGGFKPGRLYELIYRARDPLVLGVGFAAMRDLGSFLKYDERDLSNRLNPAFRENQRAIVMGSSQSGRFLRSFLHLGFNQDEDGNVVFDGAMPHIGGGLMPLNLRFAQPGRAWGQTIDHLYPAYDFPFSYARQQDPLTGRRQGVLDRCRASGTCPRLFHVATALEFWEGRQSLGLTDPLGLVDVEDPANVRTFIMGSTQHGAAPLPLPTAEPFGVCQQQPNPNPQVWTMRALLVALTEWVRDNRPPPDGVAPRIADGTLVAPDQVRFPVIPGNSYGNVTRPPARFLAVHNPLHVLNFGPDYVAEDSSGIISIEPPKAGAAAYGVLVPQVDADGNDLGGVRSLFQRVPIGTYTGWNLGRRDRFEDGFCSLQGSFIPFARTRQERLDIGDPRLSLEERYPTKESYVEMMRGAAAALVEARMLLPADAARLIGQAEAEGLRLGP